MVYGIYPTLVQRLHVPDSQDPPPRVLVAEDDREIRQLIAAALAGDGFLVSEARDGQELLEIVRAADHEDGEPPDLVISDIRMPGLSGLQALAELRPLLCRSAVILITAYGDADTRAQARALGAAGIFDKPFELDDLRTVALNLARRRP